jgi:DNA-binding IclR family transcriptional regulator
VIKVIAKTFDILELLEEHNRLSLKEVAEKTGNKKTTAANILRSLVDLGYLQQDVANNYLLSRKLYALGAANYKKDILAGVSEQVARDLAARIREAVVVAIYEKGERYTITESNVADQGIIVNTNMYKNVSIYNTATGRILLAFIEEAELNKLIRSKGLPKKEEWPEAVTRTNMVACLERIRQERLVKMVTHDGNVHALAVPVEGPDGTVWAALGVYLPIIRSKGIHLKNIVKGVVQTGQQMTRLLVDKGELS